MQGVTVADSFKGRFRCQHCGTLLRIKNYGKFFWYFYISVIVILTMLILGRKSIFANLPVDPGIVWILLVIMILITFTFGLWKHAVAEKVES
jgi:hypothetical protein